VWVTEDEEPLGYRLHFEPLSEIVKGLVPPTPGGRIIA
jgi:hypothetical protein